MRLFKQQAVYSLLDALRQIASRSACIDCGKPYIEMSGWKRCKTCRSAKLATKYIRLAKRPDTNDGWQASRARNDLEEHRRKILGEPS